jgi:hypothetical protein
MTHNSISCEHAPFISRQNLVEGFQKLVGGYKKLVDSFKKLVEGFQKLVDGYKKSNCRFQKLF